ncbi:DUF1576 domain-containing protein [Alkaliphilus sp. B6464]|uniref:DUF1576 domain-containing protein n=1 Tax=Alkaliphilus sp. B6464 TaxID=2731219 RepID=UPI001BA995E2|nr:DUF1576 domain-containing protein [Alkaliphilus sp. B6464]QUH18910.1 DUF1576 domain-containing protein [Alkaliphilus sp. B6464]
MQNPIEHIMDNKSEKQSTLNNAIIVSDVTKYGVVLFYAVFILISAFYFNNIAEIIGGICRIIVAPSILVSDYIVIGNIGSTLVNSGLVMIASIVIAKISNAEMNGPLVAAIFTIGAFAFFGKNIYNIWSIFLGVYFYALLRKEKFSKYIIVAFFGTALGPLVSQISFGLDFPIIYGVILGNIAGVMAGFIMPPLATHFSKFHQGFNLYNMGFTAGIVGSLFMSILRGYGKNNEALAIVSKGNNLVFTIYLSIIFTTMIMLGYILNNRSFAGYGKLLKRSGRASSDFIALEGFGLTMVNMGLVGFLALAYVILVKGELNGPTIGGILTIVAFAAFGKHARNILPIFLGVFLACATQVWDVNATGPLLAALFGTTLAPIAGQYGWKIGTLAGFTHMTLVMNTGYLHGGMNLYNNGFAGGIVAASLVPIVNGIMKRDE